MKRDRIIQIIPAHGWRAAHRDDDGKLFAVPVALWGLKRSGDVVGLEGRECIDESEDCRSFYAYYGPGERVPERAPSSNPLPQPAQKESVKP